MMNVGVSIETYLPLFQIPPLYESTVLAKVLSYRNVFITYIDSPCVVMSYTIHITW